MVTIGNYGDSKLIRWDDGTKSICYQTQSGMFLGQVQGYPVLIKPFGDQYQININNGAAKIMAYRGGSLWYAGSSDDGSGGTPGTPSGGGTITPPPTGTYAAIFPCAVHNVSDSFSDHVARGSVNPGTDYTASYGSDVWSVADGVVTDVTTTISGSGGRMIHIDNNDGSGADYLHLSVQHVTVGQTVTQGQLIAQSGASGYGSEHYYGAHLHISYRLNHSHGYWNDGNIDFDAFVHSEGLS